MMLRKVATLLLVAILVSVSYAELGLKLKVLNDGNGKLDVSSIAFTPDSSRFVVGGLDRTVKTFRISGALESTFEVRDYVNAVDISQDGKFLAAGGDGFMLEIFEWKCNDNKCVWVPFQSFSAPVEQAKQLKKHERFNFILGKILDVSFSHVDTNNDNEKSNDLVVGSGGWETGIVALLSFDQDANEFKYEDTFSKLFTKWAISCDFHSFDGKHVLAASPDQAISILELEPSSVMWKDEGSQIKWYIRDDDDRWQIQPLYYENSNSNGGLVEFHRLSNNIQNIPTTKTNNFIRSAQWLKTDKPGDFVTVGHEGHVRVYSWDQDKFVFNCTNHWKDATDGTPIADVGVGRNFFVSVSHGRQMNLVVRDDVSGVWEHAQRVDLEAGGLIDGNSGARAVGVSNDGKTIVVGGRSIALYAVEEMDMEMHVQLNEDAKLTSMPLDDEIRDRHYRIE